MPASLIPEVIIIDDYPEVSSVEYDGTIIDDTVASTNLNTNGAGVELQIYDYGRLQLFIPEF